MWEILLQLQKLLTELPFIEWFSQSVDPGLIRLPEAGWEIQLFFELVILFFSAIFLGNSHLIFSHLVLFDFFTLIISLALFSRLFNFFSDFPLLGI